MVNLGSFQSCVCRKMPQIHALCAGSHRFAEQGKSVALICKSGESVTALVLDGCIFTDNLPKCDGLFVFESSSNNVLALVELKGTDIPQAFVQLAYVKFKRPEYSQIKQMCMQQIGQLKEKCFIVSNGAISKVEHEKLEQHYRIRVFPVLHSTATTPIPNLRNYL
jgi:hypothetical protein